MKIFRIVSVLLILFGAVSFSHAQFAVGAKGGINFSSFRGDKTKQAYEAVPSFNIGAYVKRPFFPFLQARAEILYNQQAGNLHDYTVIAPDLKRIHARVTFHNLTVPVLAEFGLPSLNEDNLQPKLLVGGFYSYTFSARESYVNVARVDYKTSIQYDGHSTDDDQYYKSQFGLMAGIGAEVKLFSRPVSFEFRYQYNLNRANQAGTQTDYNMALTHQKWGNSLYLSTVSVNVGVTLLYF